MLTRTTVIAVALLAGMTVLSAQSAGGRGGGRAGRFKIYPPEAVNRGLQAYNSTCGYCHGARGKGGQAGPDLIVSNVTLHDEDGVQLAMHVRGAALSFPPISMQARRPMPLPN
jgi:mono/diheme cytochrome c family protein